MMINCFCPRCPFRIWLVNEKQIHFCILKVFKSISDALHDSLHRQAEKTLQKSKWTFITILNNWLELSAFEQALLCKTHTFHFTKLHLHIFYAFEYCQKEIFFIFFIWFFHVFLIFFFFFVPSLFVSRKFKNCKNMRKVSAR